MKSIVAALLVWSSINSLTNLSTQKGWRGIVPLQSTREEVDRLLGTDANRRECVEFLCSYHLRDANVQVKYAVGDCKKHRGGWDVPPDTVIELEVTPKPNPQFSDLNLDLTRFKKTPMGHLEGAIYYVCEEEGFSVVVANGVVQSFRYEPTVEDRHLRCP